VTRDKHLDILELPDELRALAGECELTGGRTIFERNGRPAAILISHDEYLALRETVDIARNARLFAAMRKRETEAGREDVREAFERLRLPASLAALPLVAAALLIGEEESSSDPAAHSLAAAFARIADDPIAGAPLFEPLRGLWSYRDGPLRVVYRIVPEARYVLVLAAETVEEPLPARA
jgi:PHD/YefM family antitoxin component YafN of YafNO toxin-antitoxin module